MFAGRRRRIIEESDRVTIEAVAEEQHKHEEQYMKLRDFHEQLSQQEKEQLLARLPSIKG